MTIIRDITGYAVSRDYAKLYEMAQKQSVVCVVDYRNFHDDPITREVARTHCVPSENRPGESITQVSSRCITHVYACNAEGFIKQCQPLNLEWLVPNVTNSMVYCKHQGKLVELVKCSDCENRKEC